MRLLLVLAVFMLAGCAGSEKLRGELRYGMETSAEGRRIYFPPPPDPPRYVYAGELVGEGNFFFAQPKLTFWDEVLRVLTGWDGSSANKLELLRPQSVVTDDSGRVFVTDIGRLAVFVFDSVLGEARLMKNAYGNTPFLAPTGITMSDKGELFVADSDAGFVARLNVDGTTNPPLGFGLLKRPTGLAFDKVRQRLLVADTAESDIKVFDLEGRLLSTIGNFGDRLGEFNRPTFMAVWRNELYVADTMNARVQVLDLESGEPIRSVGTRGTYIGQMVRPKGVAVDSEGNLYVVESYHDHLLIFNRSGQFLLPIGGTGYTSGSFYLPAGLWIDKRNRVYLADLFNGRVVTYMFLGDEGEAGAVEVLGDEVLPSATVELSPGVPSVSQ